MLVTGATGETGGYTTERLLDEGFEARALVHNADAHSDRLKSLGAEVMVGDLLEPNDVRRALEDVSAAYLVYPIRPV